MEKLLELLKAYLTAFAAHPNRLEALTQLHKEAQPIAQHFIDMGHGIEREESKVKITAAERERDQAKADLVKANEANELLKKDKPDLAALNTQHQNELAEKDRKYAEEKEQLKGFNRQVLLDRDVALLRNKFKAKDVNDEFARIHTQDTELLDRIKHDEKGKTTVYQAGTRTPYTVAQGQDALDPVFEELLKKIPPRGFDVDVDSGTEVSGHSGQTGGGGKNGGRGNVYDKIRKDTEDRVKDQSSADLATKRATKLKGNAPARKI